VEPGFGDIADHADASCVRAAGRAGACAEEVSGTLEAGLDAAPNCAEYILSLFRRRGRRLELLLRLALLFLRLRGERPGDAAEARVQALADARYALLGGARDELAPGLEAVEALLCGAAHKIGGGFEKVGHSGGRRAKWVIIAPRTLASRAVWKRTDGNSAHRVMS
jgi:hypothetical protein